MYFSAWNVFEQKRLQVLQNIVIRVCLGIKDPTTVHVKDLHKMANIVPIDVRRSYLQGILCYRLIKLGSIELVQNRRTCAADSPLVRQYTSFTMMVGASPSNAAFHTWNCITPEIRLSTSSEEEFKRKYQDS